MELVYGIIYQLIYERISTLYKRTFVPQIDERSEVAADIIAKFYVWFSSSHGENFAKTNSSGHRFGIVKAAYENTKQAIVQADKTLFDMSDPYPFIKVHVNKEVENSTLRLVHREERSFGYWWSWPCKKSLKCQNAFSTWVAIFQPQTQLSTL